MNTPILHETFENPTLNSRLQWFNPPANWRIEPGGLVIEPDAETDFWRKTHYGFVADNGHFLFANIEGDFSATTTVHFAPAHQYDQAGLMLRISAECWLKTSIEFEPGGPNQLGAVVTNGGYSDWSTQDVSPEVQTLTVRITREGRTTLVEYLTQEDRWSQLRLVHLHQDDGVTPVQVGLYACSPKGSGLRAQFAELKIGRAG